MELYKFNQEEQLNSEKFYLRSKRKFVQYFVPGKVGRGGRVTKFTSIDWEKKQEEDAKKQEENKLIKGFDQMYLAMIESRQKALIMTKGVDDD